MRACARARPVCGTSAVVGRCSAVARGVGAVIASVAAAMSDAEDGVEDEVLPEYHVDFDDERSVTDALCRACINDHVEGVDAFLKSGRLTRWRRRSRV